MDNNFIPRGMEIVKQAVIEDNKDNLETALSLYRQALGYFVTGIKYVRNERSKEAVRERMTQYMNRAEQIKEALEARNNPQKKAIPVGGEDEKDGPDAESKKLQDALSSAIVRVKPNVKWDDVAGLDVAKSLLKEAVIFPIRFPQLFTGKRKPWRGILLYGPPGTGKSYIAKAVATEAGSSCFLSVSSSDLVSKFQGESERLVRNLFELARANAPSIIFIDEVDSLCGARDDSSGQGSSRRIITEFLVQMQGVGQNNTGVLVLGATNTPWDLDSAIRRRFEKRVYIPLPEQVARIRLFEIEVGSTPHTLTHRDFKRLAKKTAGFSGSDISVVVRDALYEPVRQCQMATHFRQVPDPDPFREEKASIMQRDSTWSPQFCRLYVNRLEVFAEDKKGAPLITLPMSRATIQEESKDIISISPTQGQPLVLKVEEDQLGEWVAKLNQASRGEVSMVYEPCSPTHREGKRMNIMEMDGSLLKPPKVSYSHFVNALRSAKPSVGPDDLGQLEEWTQQFGQDG